MLNLIWLFSKYTVLMMTISEIKSYFHAPFLITIFVVLIYKWKCPQIMGFAYNWCIWVYICKYTWCTGFPGHTSGKEPASQCKIHKRHRFNLWVRKTPWRRAQHPTHFFFNGEFYCCKQNLELSFLNLLIYFFGKYRFLREKLYFLIILAKCGGWPESYLTKGVVMFLSGL